MKNRKDIDLNEIFKCYEDIKTNLLNGTVLNRIGQILLNVDNQHIFEAENWIKKAIETNREYGMKWHLARDYALYAELFRRKKDIPQAREKLANAIEIFRECGADGWVQRYEKELAAL